MGQPHPRRNLLRRHTKCRAGCVQVQVQVPVPVLVLVEVQVEVEVEVEVEVQVQVQVPVLVLVPVPVLVPVEATSMGFARLWARLQACSARCHTAARLPAPCRLSSSGIWGGASGVRRLRLRGCPSHT